MKGERVWQTEHDSCLAEMARDQSINANLRDSIQHILDCARSGDLEPSMADMLVDNLWWYGREREVMKPAPEPPPPF